MTEPLTRRRAVQLAVASVMPAAAGCLGTTGDEATWYADWLPDGTRTSFAAIELGPETESDAGGSIIPIVLPRLSEGSQQPDEPLDIEVSEITTIDDPLVAYPLLLGTDRLTRSAVVLATAGLYPLIDTPTQFESVARRILATGPVTIVTGAFERAELRTRLTTETLLTTQYERSEDDSGFDRYTPIDSPDSVEAPPVVAVSEDTVVTARTAAQMDRAIAVATGARPPIVEQSETAAWLVEQVKTADLVAGTIGTSTSEATTRSATPASPANTGFSPTAEQEVIAALTVDSETAATAQFALDTDSLEDSTRERIQTEFGTAGRERSRTIDSTRVTVRASYDSDTIGVGRSGGNADSDSSREQLSPSAARALVPEGTLEFWYVPPTGGEIATFWVETAAETDAAALRVQTTLTGDNGSGVQPRNPPVTAGIKLAAPADPAGDTLTVFAVDDEGAIGEVTSRQAPTDAVSTQRTARLVPADAVSFQYTPPGTGRVGSLSVSVEQPVDVETLVVREIGNGVSGRAGSLGTTAQIGPGQQLEIPVGTDSPGAVLFASVDGATGEVARWTGPES